MFIPIWNEFWICSIQSVNQRTEQHKKYKKKEDHMKTRRKFPTKKWLWGARPCHAQLWSVTINGWFFDEKDPSAELRFDQQEFISSRVQRRISTHFNLQKLFRKDNEMLQFRLCLLFVWSSHVWNYVSQNSWSTATSIFFRDDGIWTSCANEFGTQWVQKLGREPIMINSSYWILRFLLI